MNEHNTSKTKAWKHVCMAVANTPGGLHVQASTAFWSHKGPSDWDISLTLQAVCWSLHTRAFLAKWHAGESDFCSLCGLTSDTVPHRLGGCTHPAINSSLEHRMSGWCTTLVAGVADCYSAQGSPWLIPVVPRDEASHSFLRSCDSKISSPSLCETCSHFASSVAHL